MQILKSVFGLFIFLLSGLLSVTQAQKAQTPKSLLWQISGNGLQSPSYLYGTMHMLCKEDASLSDSLVMVIEYTERVYMELDMDNLIEMLGAISKMKMKNDTTLRDLMTEDEYQKVKTFFESQNSILPFSVLETYKPLLASSTILESGLPCKSPVAMEQMIMEEAKSKRKRIEGLETMAYQMSIFDSIPYKLQAEQLIKYATSKDSTSDTDKELNEMMEAYREQDLDKLGEFLKKNEEGMAQFEDLLLNNRNRNWVEKLKIIMKERPVTIAVGAGHLPGKNGLIELLRKEGYQVKPVKNKIQKQNVI